MTPELRKALREAVRLGEEYNWVPTSDAEILERNRLIAERIIETVIYKHADELLSLVGGWVPVAYALMFGNAVICASPELAEVEAEKTHFDNDDPECASSRSIRPLYALEADDNE